MSAASVVTIGSFDGVHLGHAALLERARGAASGCGARVVAMVFHPHPLSALRPDAAPPALTTFAQRERLLRAHGADEVVRLDPASGVLALSAEAFIARIVASHAPVAVVEGPDFRFGRGREGCIETLRSLGERAGFETHVVEQRSVVLVDQSVAPVSSSLTRWLVECGRVRDAAALLGRLHEMEGVVERGDQRGRLLNMRTANLRSECLPPRDGVYAGFAALPDGSERACAISVGTKPMFDGVGRAVEGHVLDWDGPEEYGWGLRLSFVEWVRDQARFENVEALVRQMWADVERVRAICARRKNRAPSCATEARA